MPISVIELEQPKLWISLVAGGSLTVGQAYYFLGYVGKGAAYYGEANSIASAEVSITPTTGNQSIKIEWFKTTGGISSVADAGGGVITITTSSNHGLSTGNTVYIRGTTSYNGTYTIANASGSVFNVTKTYVASETGTWFADIGYNTNANGIVFKWDKYTMIDAVDGLPYQWLNLNDPAHSARTEFDLSGGHTKWTRQCYVSYHTGNSVTFTQESTTVDDVNGKLYDGTALSSIRYNGNTRSLTDICWRKTYYGLDTNIAQNKGRLAIIISGTDNTVATLIEALIASGYTDRFQIGYNLTAGTTGKTITIFGSIFNASSATATFDDCNLILLGGQICYGGYSASGVTFNRSTIFQLSMSYYQWADPEMVMNDTSFCHSGNSLILDNASGANFAPKNYQSVGSGMTFYNKAVANVNLVGGYGLLAFQWRYQRADNTSSMSNFYIKYFYIHLVDNNGDYTGYMTNVEFVNQGITSYDVWLDNLYITADSNKIMECVDVFSDRTGKQIIVYAPNDPPNSKIKTDLWNMRFNVNLTVLDSAGVAINGATVLLYWDTGSTTDTTDSNGEATVLGLSYTLSWDSRTADTYYTASAFKQLTLTVSKAGYETYEINNFTIYEGQNLIITLKTAIDIMITNKGIGIKASRENIGLDRDVLIIP